MNTPLDENERLQWNIEKTIHTFFTAMLGGVVGTLIVIIWLLKSQL